MTNREFYQAVIDANVSAELTDFAAAAIDKLDKHNASRKSKPTKSQAANENFKVEIIKFLTGKEDFTLCSAIAEHFSVTTQKATGVLALMVKDGTVEVADVKAPKQGKRKGYKLVTAREEENGE